MSIFKHSGRFKRLAHSTENVWKKLMSIANQPGVINLGQGYPNFNGSTAAREAAARAILEGQDASCNQYSPAAGVPKLRSAICEFYGRTEGIDFHPEEVLITASGTEALHLVMQTYLDEGSEVIVFEPFFPWYVHNAIFAGADVRYVRLPPPTFKLEEESLRGAFSERTQLCIINTPHNPTGHVLSAEELHLIVRVCKEHGVLILSDEVYDGQVFGDRKHMSILGLPEARDCSIRIGSSSKLLSLTGWRVGWILCNKELLQPMEMLHTYSTYCAPTPLQHGITAALSDPAFEVSSTSSLFRRNAELLCDALRDVGLVPYIPEGGYFVVADVSSTGLDDFGFCKALVEQAKVAAIPLSLFYGPESPPRHLVRFAICKEESTILEALERIRTMRF